MSVTVPAAYRISNKLRLHEQHPQWLARSDALEYLLFANGGESVELSHQLRMWPSRAGRRPTRSSAAFIAVCLQVLDGQRGARTSKLAAKWGLGGVFHAAELILCLLSWSLAFPPAQSGPCGVGPILCLPFSLTLSLPTVLRSTTNGRKRDWWDIAGGGTEMEIFPSHGGTWETVGHRLSSANQIADLGIRTSYVLGCSRGG